MIDAFEKTPDPTFASKNVDTPTSILGQLVSKDMVEAINDLVNHNVQKKLSVVVEKLVDVLNSQLFLNINAYDILDFG